MPYFRTLLSIIHFARFCYFPIFLSQSTTKLPLKHGPNKTYFSALVKPNRVKTGLRQGASSGVLRGRLRRVPLTSRGGAGVAAGPVYWHMTQAVHTVLAGATRAQAYVLVFASLHRCPCWARIISYQPTFVVSAKQRLPPPVATLGVPGTVAPRHCLLLAACNEL